ncbi:MAG: EAL domain-containing protein [Myxococcaceae bacterium]|nr:EAL domain-containing protein [Myxococcaceae bacterium]
MGVTEKYGKYKPSRILPALDPDPDATALEISLGEIGVAVIETDVDGKVMRMNATAERVTGWSAIEARNEPLSSVFKLVNPPPEKAAMFAPDRSGVLERHDKELVPVRHSVTEAPPREKGPKKGGRIVLFRALSAEQLLSLQVAAGKSDADALTGLLGRRAFLERIARASAESKRRGTGPHGLCYFDLDRFRIVNVTCGHDAGDDLLQWVAGRIHEVLGPGDSVARIAADEFAVLLANRSEAEIERVVKDLKKRLLEFRFAWGDKSFSVAASFGVCTFGATTEQPAELLRRANAACRKAKEQGGGRIHLLGPDDEKAKDDRRSMDWVASLQKHLADGRLKLFAQGVHPLKGKGRDGAHFEVLVRQLDDDGQLRSPVRIIAAAENTGLMGAIDRFVIQKALEALAELPKASLKKIDVCAINLSGISLAGQDLLDFVVGELGRTKVSPRKICFEITETAALANLDEVLWLMQELKGMGCRFSIDDFGSGHASYAYVEKLPVDHVKIDGAFVRDMLVNPVHRAIVESVHLIGRTMNIKTVAESVERQEIADALAEIGIDAGQGWLFDKPVPLAEALGAL